MTIEYWYDLNNGPFLSAIHSNHIRLMSIPLILALNTGQKRLLFGFDLATENCFLQIPFV